MPQVEGGPVITGGAAAPSRQAATGGPYPSGVDDEDDSPGEMWYEWSEASTWLASDDEEDT